MISELKKQIRPTIRTIKKLSDTSPEEKFQNESLRPVIKLQHDLIVCYFDDYLNRKKIKFIEFDATKKLEVISQVFSRDNQLKSDFRGMIVGLFTLEEFKVYLKMPSPINKRINSIIQQRVISHFI